MYAALDTAQDSIPPIVPEHGEYQALKARVFAEYNERQASNTLGR